MMYTNHEVDRIMQSNRHLKERNENLRLEQQSNYALKAKHKQEQEQLRFKITNLDIARDLKRRQAHEFNVLRYRQSQSRLSLEKQQAQEVALLNAS